MNEIVSIDDLVDDIDFRRYLLDYLEIYNRCNDLLSTRYEIKKLHPKLSTDYLNALQYHASCELAIKGKPKHIADSHITIYQQLLKSELNKYKQGINNLKSIVLVMKALESLLKLTDAATIKMFFDNKKLNITMGDLNIIKDNINKLPEEKKNMLLEGLKLSQVPIEQTVQEQTVEMENA